MYVSRLVSAVIYIPLDAYCTLLSWIGWKLARFRNTKTSVNKRLLCRASINVIGVCRSIIRMRVQRYNFFFK